MQILSSTIIGNILGFIIEVLYSITSFIDYVIGRYQFSSVVIALIVLIILFQLIMTLINISGKQPKSLRRISASYQTPAIDPALAQLMTEKEMPDKYAFIALLTQYALDNKLKIEKINSASFDHNYKITVIDKELLQSFPLLKRILGKRSTSVSTRQYQINMHSEFAGWQKSIYKEAMQKDWVLRSPRQAATKIVEFLKNIAYLITIFVILANLLSSERSWAFIAILAILMVIEALFMKGYTKIKRFYTDKGIMAANQLLAYKKAIVETTNSKALRRGYLDLEQAIPYVITWDLSKNVEKADLHFPQNPNLPDNWCEGEYEPFADSFDFDEPIKESDYD